MLVSRQVSSFIVLTFLHLVLGLIFMSLIIQFVLSYQYISWYPKHILDLTISEFCQNICQYIINMTLITSKNTLHYFSELSDKRRMWFTKLNFFSKLWWKLFTMSNYNILSLKCSKTKNGYSIHHYASHVIYPRFAQPYHH